MAVIDPPGEPLFSSPRIVEILRHGPSGIERRRRNSQADARESGNRTPE